MGFIPKSYSGTNLLNALRTVMDGDIYIPETISKQLHSLPSVTHDNVVCGNALTNAGITRRQHEVPKLLLDSTGRWTLEQEDIK